MSSRDLIAGSILIQPMVFMDLVVEPRGDRFIGLTFSS
jgi:RPE4 domain-containing protein